jgi:hypothetical protein
LLGIGTFLFFGFLAYDVGLNPVVGGPTNPVALSVLVLSFVAGALVYFISRAYHKAKHGIDISLVLKEVPPE